MKRILPAILCFLLLFLTVAKPALALTFDEFREKAKELINHKVTPEAFLKLSADVLAKDVGDDAEYKGYVYAMRGHAYWQKDDLKKAQAEAEAAIAANPETAMGRFVLMDVFSGQGKFEEAAKQMDILAGKAENDEDKKKYAALAANLRLEGSAVSPAVLWTAFDENEVAAEDAYKNKTVAVKGKIESITTSATGYPQVSFTVDRVGIHKVVCEFDKDARPQIAKLKKGQQAVVAGTCQGMVMKSVFLRNSRIIE